MVKKIQLTTALPSEWVEAQKGKYLDGRHYTRLVAGESTDAIKPDGSPLFKLRAGAIPRAVCEAARPSLRKAGLQTLGEHREYQSTTIGYYDLPDCRKTRFTASDPEAWSECLPFIRACNKVFFREMRGRYSVQRKVAIQTAPDWVIGKTAFTTMTVNLWDDTHDARTPVHTDRGDLAEGFGVLSILSSGDYSGGYLIFPAYQIAVDLRTTDVLLADVHEYHGNAPIVPAGAWERIACVLYYRTDMRRCPRAVGG